MNLIQIIGFCNAAVRNARRLRFSGDIFYSIYPGYAGSIVPAGKYPLAPVGRSHPFFAGTGPALRQIINRIHVLSFLFLSLLFLCGCSLKAEEPVLETFPTAEEESAETADSSGDVSPLSGNDSKPEEGKEAAENSLNKQTALKKQDEEENPDTQAAENDPDTQTASEKKEVQDDARTAADMQNRVTVHVCGAVKKEGVYTLPAGSRIRDAVEAAGGFAGDADKSYLNLAMELEDAWQIRIPTKKETEALRTLQGDSGPNDSSNQGVVFFGVSTGLDTAFIVKGGASSDESAKDPTGQKSVQGSGAETDRINLNTASKEELMKIPGVGEAKAQRIIDYREQNGRFEMVEDLMKVPGIKDASFQKMKDYITV